MRSSHAIATRTFCTSAPTAEQSRAISFMKEMRVASIALQAYLASSALRGSMVRMSSRRRTKGA